MKMKIDSNDFRVPTNLIPITDGITFETGGYTELIGRSIWDFAHCFCSLSWLQLPLSPRSTGARSWRLGDTLKSVTNNSS